MFIKNYSEFLLEVRDKKPKVAGEKTEKDHKDGNHKGVDKELEKKVNDELEAVEEECVRCGEHIESCKCEEEDPWSTQNYHRVPKGKEQTAKPKQEFKK
tara:strand:+ start:307 stop:603 length:297 start_codon:yes stop_codon:yes gene_type:complete